MKEEFLAHFDTALPLWVIAMRLGAAFFLGVALGLEREWRSRPAGLRTHILVCVAAATFALVATEIIEQPIFESEHLRIDPIRLIEAITGGVAFLAAGFIVFFKGEVHGITTGAGMWLAASVGLAAGLGVFSIAILATILGILTLTMVRQAELWLEFKEKKRSQDAPSSPAKARARDADDN